MEKDIRNTDAVARKLKLASTKTTNLRREEIGEKQEMFDKQKVEAIAKKQ